MPKKERELARGHIEEQIPETKAAIGGTVAEAQSQLPGAKERAAATFGAATGAAGGLGDPSNLLAAGKAFGELNPYATGLATTGGISDEEAQAMETAATRGVRSVYDVLGAEVARKGAITGGYGGAGEAAQMARQAGQVSAEAGTGARAKIAEVRQAGKISGAGMVSEQQMTGADLVNKGQIAGAQLLTEQYKISQDQSNAVMDMILKAQATGITLSQADVAMMVELSKQKGTFGAVAEGVGQVGEGVGAVLAGI